MQIDETHEIHGTGENLIAWQSILVNQWITAFNEHNVAAIVALYSENAELFDSGMKRPRRGLHEIEHWFTTRFRTMPSITYTPDSQLFTDNQAVVTWTTSGRAPRLLGRNLLRRSFHVDGISLFTLQDNHITAQRGYYDHLSVLEQLLPPLKWIVPPRL
ncbi:MAG: nuclear transport factor 2 family protein [Ktedonobacteraceae bacterium]